MCKLSATLPAIVATPHCPNSSTVIHCDECGCLTLAWIEDEKRWTTDCLYDCLCLSCFTDYAELHPFNPDGDLFPNRVEFHKDGTVSVHRSEEKPRYTFLSISKIEEVIKTRSQIGLPPTQL